jgi:HSP20 family molecular chaperone IbpA
MPGHQASIRILRVRQAYAQFEVEPWAPPLNMVELEDRFLLVAELAGLDPAQVQIDVHPSLVIIYGVRSLTFRRGLRRLYRMEIATGPFQVFQPLDRVVDPEQASAEYTDGLLEVELPFARVDGMERVMIPIRIGNHP